jgi:hypothetical protein
MNGFKIRISARKFVKKSKLAPKISFLWKKNEIRKSYDTVPLIHNSIRVQTSFDRVLTVKNINFPPITAWSMCKNSESNYFPRFNTRKVITFRVLRRGK